MTSLKDLKMSVIDIEDALRDIHCDSVSPLPTRDAIRAAMCRLDFARERIRNFVYEAAE
jgi:hypothetical protein